jgi:hypothetical protein
MWRQLVEQTTRKGAKLKDASDQQAFNRNVEDVEVWLAEIEGQLMSEDYGKVRFPPGGSWPDLQGYAIQSIKLGRLCCRVE